jgi:hypothetical protein
MTVLCEFEDASNGLVFEFAAAWGEIEGGDHSPQALVGALSRLDRT